ncbi:MAG: MBL fold metallo-hydrolase [Burkholderiaceae bacterium]
MTTLVSHLRHGALALALLLQAWAWPVQAAEADGPAMKVEQVGPHSYYVQGLSALGSSKNQNFISNAGFVVTPESVVVIDALGSPKLAERLTAEIRKITPLPISDVILTHYHADHIYGLQFFKALGARITAHVAAKEYMQSDTARLRLQASRTDLAPWIDDKTELVAADTWIDGPTSLKIGGMLFELDHVGPSHTPEDLTIYVPSERVLFAGDLFFNGRLPFVGKANSSQWIKSLELMLAHDSAAVVLGHGSASTDPKKTSASPATTSSSCEAPWERRCKTSPRSKKPTNRPTVKSSNTCPCSASPHERLQHLPVDGSQVEAPENKR